MEHDHLEEGENLKIVKLLNDISVASVAKSLEKDARLYIIGELGTIVLNRANPQSPITRSGRNIYLRFCKQLFQF